MHVCICVFARRGCCQAPFQPLRSGSVRTCVCVGCVWRKPPHTPTTTGRSRRAGGEGGEEEAAVAARRGSDQKPKEKNERSVSQRQPQSTARVQARLSKKKNERKKTDGKAQDGTEKTKPQPREREKKKKGNKTTQQRGFALLCFDRNPNPITAHMCTHGPLGRLRMRVHGPDKFFARFGKLSKLIEFS